MLICSRDLDDEIWTRHEATDDDKDPPTTIVYWSRAIIRFPSHVDPFHFTFQRVSKI